MQYTILLFFQQIANPILDIAVEALTILGESTPVVLIFAFLYWCVDKKRGFAILGTLLTSLVSANIIKSIFRVERPFVKHPEIAGKRTETATGYSFPSGHTTTAATFYTSVTLNSKCEKRNLTIAIILSVLIGVSRLYLGVHWPTDVLGGLILGFLVSFLLYDVFIRLYENKRKLVIFCLVAGACLAVLSLVLTIALQWFNADSTAYIDLLKIAALGSGALFGIIWDEKKIKFTTAGSLGQKLLRYLVGIAGLVIISVICTFIPKTVYPISSLCKYAFIGLWATAILPLFAQKLRLMNHEAE